MNTYVKVESCWLYPTCVALHFFDGLVVAGLLSDQPNKYIGFPRVFVVCNFPSSLATRLGSMDIRYMANDKAGLELIIE